MTVEAGEKLFDHDGAATGSGTVTTSAETAPPPSVPESSPPPDEPATPPDDRTPVEEGGPGPDRSEGAGPEGAEDRAEESGTARPAAPAWLAGAPAKPWPPPGAVRPRTARPSRVPPPRRPPGAAAAPARIPGPPPMPRIPEDPAILGLSRITRGRLGSRLFTWFFVLVFALIAVQMVISILYPW